MEIELSAEEIEQLMRPVAGSGGWQSLLRKLQRTGEVAERERMRVRRIGLRRVHGSC